MANLRLAALRHRLAISTYRLGDCVLLIFVLTACLSAVAEASHATTSSYPKLHHRSPFSGTAKLFSKQQKSASNDVFKTSRRSSFLIDVVMPDLRGGDNLRGVVSDMLLKSDDRTATVAAVAVDYGPFIEGAYDWCCNLGAPSALVAGAVIATLYENMHSGDLEVVVTDSWWVQLGKKVTRLLLLSAFALETLSIFVTTVTGTMLLSITPKQMFLSDVVVESPLEFMRENF